MSATTAPWGALADQSLKPGRVTEITPTFGWEAHRGSASGAAGTGPSARLPCLGLAMRTPLQIANFSFLTRSERRRSPKLNRGDPVGAGPGPG